MSKHHGWVRKYHSQRAREMKKKHLSAFLVLDTLADNAVREWKDPLWIPPGAAFITAEMCGLTPKKFSNGLAYLEKELDIEVIHRGRQDKNSRINEFIPPIPPPITGNSKATQRQLNLQHRRQLNGTVAFIRSLDIYDINLYVEENHEETQLFQAREEQAHIEESEEVKNHHSTLKRGDDSDDMEDDPPSPPSQSSLDSSPLFHKEKKRPNSRSWEAIYQPDWLQKWQIEEKTLCIEMPQTIIDFVNKFLIPEHDIRTWLKVHTIDKIKDTINFVFERKKVWLDKFKVMLDQDNIYYVAYPPTKEVVKYTQSALTGNWAIDEKNKSLNRIQIPKLIKEHNLESDFDLTPKDYCRDNETGNDYQYKMDPKDLQVTIQRLIERKFENELASRFR